MTHVFIYMIFMTYSNHIGKSTLGMLIYMNKEITEIYTFSFIQ